MSTPAEIRSHSKKLWRWAIAVAAIVAVSLLVVLFVREFRRHRALLQFRSVGMWLDDSDGRTSRYSAPTGFVQVRSDLPELLKSRCADETALTWFVHVRSADVLARDSVLFEEALSATVQFPEIEFLRVCVRDWKPQYWDRIERLSGLEGIHIVTERVDESFSRLRRLPRLRVFTCMRIRSVKVASRRLSNCPRKPS